MAVDGAHPAPTTAAAASTGRGDHVHAPIRTSRLGLPRPREGSPVEWSRERRWPGGTGLDQQSGSSPPAGRRTDGGGRKAVALGISRAAEALGEAGGRRPAA